MLQQLACCNKGISMEVVSKTVDVLVLGCLDKQAFESVVDGVIPVKCS